MKSIQHVSRCAPGSPFQKRIILQQRKHWRSRHQRRNYALHAPGAPTLEVFNPKIKYLQKERAAENVIESRNVEYLRDEVAQRLCDRLLVRLP